MTNVDRLEWDSAKVTENLRRHGVAFHEAIKVFRDLSAIEELDEREGYGEDRINLVGMCDGMLLRVTFTERGEKIRIISARRVERRQHDNYYRQNSP